MSIDTRAFEYVLGTLPRSERRALERAMASDDALAAEVRFWEEQLMAIQDPEAARTPPDDAWQRIQARIAPESGSSPARRRWWPWALACSVLLVALSLPLLWFTGGESASPNSDYVAVLTDERGQARLTAITLAGGETLWLQWQGVALDDASSAQLWAVSRRDGRTRPIAVFERAETRTLSLDQAARRLIADAEYLLLTEEEPGGSPLDQPSAEQIARGVCVRLSAEKAS